MAFDHIRQALISPDIMAFPTDDGHYILYIDTSDETVKAILTQVQAVVGKVIAYGSQTPYKSGKNYCTTDWELLAVKFLMGYYNTTYYFNILRLILTMKHFTGYLA